MTSTALSKNGVLIRLTDERWAHITDEHCELAGLRLEALEAITDPLRVIEGADGELLAVSELELSKYIIVVYHHPTRAAHVGTPVVS